MFPRKTDLLSALAPLIYTSKMLGIPQLSLWDFFTHKTMKPSKIFSIVLCMCQLLFTVLVSDYTIRENFFAELNCKDFSCYSLVTSITLAYSGSLLMVVHVLMAVFNRHVFVKVIEDLNALDFLFKYKKFKKTKIYTKIYYLTAITLFQLIVVAVIICIVAPQYDSNNGLLGTMQWGAFMIPSLINGVFRIWYIGLSSIVCNKFENINEYLRNYKEEIERNLEKSKNSSKKSTPQKFTFGNIEDICEIHQHICEISSNINSMYSFEILLSAGYTFIVVTSQLYFMYLVYVWGLQPGVTKLQGALDSIFWISKLIVEIILTASMNGKAKREARRTPVELHELANEIDRIDIHNKVNHVSIKMMSHVVKLTAGGFFDMDMTAIYSMCGSVASYLIILIQFDLAGRRVTH